jgi:hypothetical protein
MEASGTLLGVGQNESQVHCFVGYMGTIMYYPPSRPRGNRLYREDFSPSSPHLGRGSNTIEEAGTRLGKGNTWLAATEIVEQPYSAIICLDSNSRSISVSKVPLGGSETALGAARISGMPLLRKRVTRISGLGLGSIVARDTTKLSARQNKIRKRFGCHSPLKKPVAFCVYGTIIEIYGSPDADRSVRRFVGAALVGAAWRRSRCRRTWWRFRWARRLSFLGWRARFRCYAFRAIARLHSRTLFLPA